MASLFASSNVLILMEPNDQKMTKHRATISAHSHGEFTQKILGRRPNPKSQKLCHKMMTISDLLLTWILALFTSICDPEVLNLNAEFQ